MTKMIEIHQNTSKMFKIHLKSSKITKNTQKLKKEKKKDPQNLQNNSKPLKYYWTLKK